MKMKYDRNLTTLFDCVSSDTKVYKNALVSGIEQLEGYKRYVSIKRLEKTLISKLWLNYIDTLTWDELAAVDREKWIADKKYELGI